MRDAGSAVGVIRSADRTRLCRAAIRSAGRCLRTPSRETMFVPSSVVDPCLAVALGRRADADATHDDPRDRRAQIAGNDTASGGLRHLPARGERQAETDRDDREDRWLDGHRSLLTASVRCSRMTRAGRSRASTSSLSWPSVGVQAAIRHVTWISTSGAVNGPSSAATASSQGAWGTPTHAIAGPRARRSTRLGAAAPAGDDRRSDHGRTKRRPQHGQSSSSRARIRTWYSAVSISPRARRDLSSATAGSSFGGTLRLIAQTITPMMRAVVRSGTANAMSIVGPEEAERGRTTWRRQRSGGLGRCQPPDRRAGGQPPTTRTSRGNWVRRSTRPAAASSATRSSMRTPVSPSR